MILQAYIMFIFLICANAAIFQIFFIDFSILIFAYVIYKKNSFTLTTVMSIDSSVSFLLIAFNN
jgi:hypothetical protein